LFRPACQSSRPRRDPLYDSIVVGFDFAREESATLVVGAIVTGSRCACDAGVVQVHEAFDALAGSGKDECCLA
jgi:hypothetical protein